MFQRADINIEKGFLMWIWWGRQGLINMRLNNKLLANKNNVDNNRFKSYMIVDLLALALKFIIIMLKILSIL